VNEIHECLRNIKHNYFSVIVLTKNYFILQVCGYGWIGLNLACYQLIYNAAGRDGASAGCQSLGGHLTLISDNQERAAIQTYLASLGLTDSNKIYIDGTDAAVKGVWRTEAGDVMTYTGMTSGQPNGGTVENCIGVSVTRIFDTGCTHTRSAICEM